MDRWTDPRAISMVGLIEWTYRVQKADVEVARAGNLGADARRWLRGGSEGAIFSRLGEYGGVVVDVCATPAEVIARVAHDAAVVHREVMRLKDREAATLVMMHGRDGSTPPPGRYRGPRIEPVWRGGLPLRDERGQPRPRTFEVEHANGRAVFCPIRIVNGGGETEALERGTYRKWYEAVCALAVAVGGKLRDFNVLAIGAARPLDNCEK